MPDYLNLSESERDAAVRTALDADDSFIEKSHQAARELTADGGAVHPDKYDPSVDCDLAGLWQTPGTLAAFREINARNWQMLKPEDADNA